MKNWEIKRYTPADCVRWNQFVDESRNGTFLFNRDYMDYHSDRFADHSLMALQGGRLLSILPADEHEGKLRSHGGLTYGGWVFPRNKVDANEVVSLFDNWKEYCLWTGLDEIIYKPVPHIYHRYPSEEDRYALFISGSSLISSQISSVISYSHPKPFSVDRRRQMRRAAQTNNYTISESSDFETYWIILEKCLMDRHDARPVHSLFEISRLVQRFPTNIRLFTISDNDGMQGGVVIYDTGITAHCQYIATTPQGRERNLLPVLFDHLIKIFESGHSYFDFGTSNENHGLVLNHGLLNQKFTMGGTGVVYNEFSIRL